jgi:hypothetical protein
MPHRSVEAPGQLALPVRTGGVGSERSAAKPRPSSPKASFARSLCLDLPDDRPLLLRPVAPSGELDAYHGEERPCCEHEDWQLVEQLGAFCDHDSHEDHGTDHGH